MSKVKDGWHICAGYQVWVENGKVMRGISKDGQRTVWLYKWVEHYATNVSGRYGLDTVREGLKSGRFSFV